MSECGRVVLDLVPVLVLDSVLVPYLVLVLVLVLVLDLRKTTTNKSCIT